MKNSKMTNAEWCIQHGIKFKNLSCKSCDDRHEYIGYYDIDGIFHECYKGKMLGDLVVESILTWLDMEHVGQILDDVEKRYLKCFIRPFRNEIKSIVKRKSYSSSLERLYFFTKNDVFYLKNFKAGTMYKGMELDKKYSLEELGL